MKRSQSDRKLLITELNTLMMAIDISRIEELANERERANAQQQSIMVAEQEAKDDLIKSIFEDEPFDPEDFMLWAAITYRTDWKEQGEKAHSLNQMLLDHTGSLLYYRRGMECINVHNAVGVIGDTALRVVRTPYNYRAIIDDTTKAMIRKTISPLQLQIEFPEKILLFAIEHHHQLKIENGRIAPGNFPTEGCIPGKGSYLWSNRGSVIQLQAHDFPSMAIDGNRAHGQFTREYSMLAPRYRNPSHNYRRALETLILVGNDDVKQALTEEVRNRESVDFSGITNAQDAYKLMGGQ